MSKMDASHPYLPNTYGLSKKQTEAIKVASRNCWYVELFCRMSLYEKK